MKAVSTIAIAILSGCGPAARPAPIALAPVAAPAVATAAPAGREIHGGVLHANLIAGELIVDAPTPTPTPTPREARIRVCVDEAAVVSATLTRASEVPGYDDAALAAVAGWRFRPFVRDGAPEAVCATAVFMPEIPGMPREMRAALMPAERELPAPTIVESRLPAEALGVAPTPGVGAVLRCRRPGSDDAPSVSLVQSSGDTAADHALLIAPMFRLVDEEAAATPRCSIGATIVRAAAPAPAPAPPPASGKPILIEQRRIAGDPRVLPSDRVKIAIGRAGVSRLLVPVKVCVDHDGGVTAVTVLKTSGFPAYDLDLINAVATWRYQPLQVDGVAAKVCFVVQFAYNQGPAPS